MQASLAPGQNRITLQARFRDGKIVSRAVNVTRLEGSSQLPFEIDWAEVGDPQDIGQYVDGGGKSFNHSHLAKFRLIETVGGLPPLPIWVPNKALSNSLTDADVERRKQMAEEEYRRLLYVAMTRAADRLVICGFADCATGRIWHR
jgi:hypothetical protein